MKKIFSSILVLSFLLSGNALAEENKWQYEDSFLTTKCFINEWPSSDNFEEFYDRYFPTVKKEFGDQLKEMSQGNKLISFSNQLVIFIQQLYL